MRASCRGPVTFALVVAVSYLSLLPQAVEAHSVTFRPQQLRNPCAAANGFVEQAIYTNTGPTDKTWAVRVSIGLNGGNAGQFVWFSVFIIDTGSGFEVARYRAAVHDWIDPAQLVQADTLTVHIGGALEVYVDIHNNDSNGQCFTIVASAAYW